MLGYFYSRIHFLGYLWWNIKYDFLIIIIFLC